MISGKQMSSELATLRINPKVHDRLREIASFYRRSMTKQVELMIDQVYEELAAEWDGAAKNETPPKGQIELPL